MKSKNLSRFSIKWRKIIHKPLTAIFKVSLTHKVKLIRDDFQPNGRPVIYAATHVFVDDIAAVCCCLQECAFLLFGTDGLNNSLSFTDSLALYLNGVIKVDRNDKQDRAESVNKMVSVLKKKGNILIFPESAWNLSPNLLVQKLHWGILGVAERADANIVPVAVDLVNEEYCVIIGKCFECSELPGKQEAISVLRDMMAALVWELIGMKHTVQRKTLTDTYWLEHINKQFAHMPTEYRAIENNALFHPKNEISLGELLADLHGIEYKNMAVDYETRQKIERLIENWTRPIKITK